MNPSQTIQKLNTKLENAKTHFSDELKKLRTGRAHPAMLDGIKAEAYGQDMPLVQLATISTPEPQLIQITPFDPNNLEAIAAAIRNDQSLGMNPTDDGRVIRVPVPPLTTERRQQIVKQLGEKVEECMIAARNARREAISELDTAKKGKDISEDEHKRFMSQVDEAMNKAKKDVDETAKAKESEIMTV